ncbi:MAG: O-antigen ligase family protein [Candidatus Azambacteria bacterium]|nr:O-antigen ligase family protein [Candidatus Azambacteria bacterium]
MLFRESTIVSIIKAGVYAVLFLPLIVIPLFLFPFATSRGFLFQILVEIIVALYLVLALKNSAYRPKKTALLLALSFYFLVLLLSTLFGLDPYRSFFGNFERMWGLFSLAHFFLFFVVLAGMFKTKEEWARLIKLALMVAALSVAFGIVQFVGSLLMSGSAPRIMSTVGNPAFFASYLFFACFFAFLFWLSNRLQGSMGYSHRFLYATLSLAALFAILATATRGAAVGLAAAFFAGAVLLAVFSKKRVLKIGAISFIALSLLGAVLLASQGSLFEKTQRITQEQFYDIGRFDAPAVAGKSGSFISRIANISLYDVTVQTRLIAWKSALGGVKESSLLGVGPDNFILAFNKQFDPAFYSYERSEVWFDHAHNIYIDMLVTHGWAGLFAYLLLFATTFYTIISLYKKGKLSAAHAFVFALFFIAYAAQNVFLFDSFSAFLMFIVALAYLNSFSQEQDVPAVRGEPVNVSFFAVPLIGVLVLSYFFTARPAAEAYYISKAESGRYDIHQTMEYYRKALAYHTYGDNEARSRMALAVAKHVQGIEVKELPSSVDAYLDEAIAALKEGIDSTNQYLLLYRLQLSDLYNLKLSRTGMASPEIEEIIRNSIAISPGRMEFEFALAQTEFLKKNYEKSIEILTTASEKNPDHPVPPWKIAQAYHFMGIDEKGIPYLERALYLGQGIRTAKEVLWAEKYYVQQQNLVKIIYIDQRMLQAGVDDTEAVRLHMNMAVVYAKLGNKERAIEHAQAIAKLDPTQKPAVDNFINSL